MRKCPQCGEEVEENSVFCQNCGSKIDVPVVTTTKSSSNGINKVHLMILFGYLTLFIQFVAILASRYNVRVINSDRIILYPLMCILLTFYVAFKLIEDERTRVHALIIVLISIFLFIFGII